MFVIVLNRKIFSSLEVVVITKIFVENRSILTAKINNFLTNN